MYSEKNSTKNKNTQHNFVTFSLFGSLEEQWFYEKLTRLGNIAAQNFIDSALKILNDCIHTS